MKDRSPNELQPQKRANSQSITAMQPQTLSNDDATSPTYSVVVPVYQSHGSVRELVARTAAVFEKVGESFEIILVDDGSTEPRTWETLKSLHDDSTHVTAARLSRNFGKSNAVLCGLTLARGAWVITLDDDLQQRPEDIPRLLELRDHDVVVASYTGRNHALAARVFSRIKRQFDRHILGLPCPMSPMKLIKSVIVEGMLKNSSPHPFVPALLSHVTTDFVTVALQHSASRHGKSRYTLARKWRQFSNLIVGNSAITLKLIGRLGVTVSLVGFLYAGYVVTRYFLGAAPPPGWSSLIVINLVFGGLILIALGIVGDYLARLLHTADHRPPFHLREVLKNERLSDHTQRS